MGRFVSRCFALLAVTFLLFAAPEEFHVLEGSNFFRKLSLLHVLWGVWLADMLAQIIPATKAVVALGSQKSFKVHFRKALSPITSLELRRRMKEANKRAYAVFAVWAVLILILGILQGKKILSDLALFWISCFFYVCDLICVLFWCPFRHFIMKNRCCTTCRIFNWDHLMMFTPLIYVGGFYCTSLVVLAVLVFLVWEWTALRHPERFDEGTNQALKCSECTDRLCIRAKKIHNV